MAVKSVGKKRSGAGKSGVVKSSGAKWNGIGSEAVAKATGKTWGEWIKLLDKDKAAAMPHKEIALHVRKKYGVGDPAAQCDRRSPGRQDDNQDHDRHNSDDAAGDGQAESGFADADVCAVRVEAE